MGRHQTRSRNGTRSVENGKMSESPPRPPPESNALRHRRDPHFPQPPLLLHSHDPLRVGQPPHTTPWTSMGTAQPEGVITAMRSVIFLATARIADELSASAKLPQANLW